MGYKNPYYTLGVWKVVSWLGAIPSSEVAKLKHAERIVEVSNKKFEVGRAKLAGLYQITDFVYEATAQGTNQQKDSPIPGWPATTAASARRLTIRSRKP